MKRRDSLKLLLLCAGAERFMDTRSVVAQTNGFVSQWHLWPDMRWTGPQHWGNRLQDWAVENGVVVCRTRAPNRTLHCLTHRATDGAFVTEVSLNFFERSLPRNDSIRAGFRIGAKGRFEDHRSAAVFGTGIDVGVDASGRLFIGDIQSSDQIDIGAPLHLTLTATAHGDRTSLVLDVRGHTNGPILATLSRPVDTQAVCGNLALLSDFPESPSPTGLATAFSHWHIDGAGITFDPTAAFGPVMFAQYTVHRQMLKLTAQLAPFDDVVGVRATLEGRLPSGAWRELDRAPVDVLSCTARFRVEDWIASTDTPYRVRVGVPLTTGTRFFTYEGTIAAEPDIATPLKAAVFSCNADHGFPDNEVVENVRKHDPHIAVFLGDQYYEGNGGFGIQTDSLHEASLDMLAKWYMFGWSYRDIFRHIPAAFIPDDHDVYHGNIWGEGGKSAPTDEGWGAVAQDQGGYKMPAEWVNAVQRTQTSHLPDPYDATPALQGIDVYYTRWDYAGVSFAILEDRKFKSAPRNVMPQEANIVNGWIQNPDFDVRQYRDLPDATLLGDRQLEFLNDWAEDWAGSTFIKVALSQTNFAAVHTIPEDAMSGAVLPGLPVPLLGEYVLGDKLAVDMDSNGWPQNQRDDTLSVLRRCATFHIAGDQHLATVVRHGIDEFDDAGYTFTVPALNNIWPRRWWPPNRLKERAIDNAPMYTGSFFDGFGNRITVYASANPRATGLEPAIVRDRVTGYGIVTFDKLGQQIRMECWPRHANPDNGDHGQYDGWPIVVAADTGDGRTPIGFLPTLQVSGLTNPVVAVLGANGNTVYVRRFIGNSFRPPVYEAATHTVRVGDPDTNRWQERTITQDRWNKGTVHFTFS